MHVCKHVHVQTRVCKYIYTQKQTNSFIHPVFFFYLYFFLIDTFCLLVLYDTVNICQSYKNCTSLGLFYSSPLYCIAHGCPIQESSFALAQRYMIRCFWWWSWPGFLPSISHMVVYLCNYSTPYCSTGGQSKFKVGNTG